MKTLKSIFVLIIFLIMVYFCTRNASAVVVDLLFTKFETQLYVMMLAALIIGAFLVGFATIIEHSRLKRQMKKLRKQHVELQNKFKQMEKLHEESSRESLPLPQAVSDSK